MYTLQNIVPAAAASQSNNYATEVSFDTKVRESKPIENQLNFINNLLNYCKHLQDFKLHNLTEGPSTCVKLTRDDALKYYEQMFTIRRLETAAGSLYKDKIIRGFCHLYSGQEACAVGMYGAMRPDDSLITAYRCHGFTYLMGVPPSKVLSELTGREHGSTRGKSLTFKINCMLVMSKVLFSFYLETISYFIPCFCTNVNYAIYLSGLHKFLFF